VCILGATGSVGRSALDVISRFPRRFRVTALCAGSRHDDLCELARRFRPKVVCLSTPVPSSRLSLPRGTRLVFGEEGMAEAVLSEGTETVLAAASGVSSIRPVLSAARAGKRIALANKELLVMAGKFLVAAARKGKGAILPVDSEHSAVFQSLSGHRREDISRIVLTASGGPFRAHTLPQMRRATPAEALGHPTWSMGAKITVDSATLMNKGLEVIEATWLFDVPADRIDVLVHPQSVIHSMVEYRDGSLIAQLGIPDMRIPIGYALAWPERLPLPLPRLSRQRMDGWTFEAPDTRRFPALALAYGAAREGGTAPAALNAANEVAVHAFLDGRIRFTDIVRVVEDAAARVPSPGKGATLDEVFAADVAAREEASRRVGRCRRPGAAPGKAGSRGDGKARRPGGSAGAAEGTASARGGAAAEGGRRTVSAAGAGATRRGKGSP
jgi:1-deoxy-D-xylulose-5-phosphate reductoisomerase